jgi:UDP:flavonoid glycosyltransferase YjiC (YdhE family)
MVRDFQASKFELPEKIRDKPGKLIFLSLGSLASADVELMQRLTSLLADCPHKFIVSKGPLHDKYELPDNMWGDKFVPQLEVLTSIDLIITHGGNNTLTESFYYGVPGFIVCPLFGDQFDNATRMQEKGLGIRLDPYNCSKEELHQAIETMLNKNDVKDRMLAASERMRKPETRTKAIKLVSDMVAKL